MIGLLTGCFTPFQDGHYDVCSQWRNPETEAADRAGFDHERCTYAQRPTTFSYDTADLDAYGRGVVAGVEDCWQRPYDEAWFAADEASPCTEVAGDPLPEDRR